MLCVYTIHTSLVYIPAPSDAYVSPCTFLLQAAYRDAEALKKQDQLIAEEFELQKLEEDRAKAQAEKEKEKKAKKKV